MSGKLAKRPRSPLFRALGKQDPPQTVTVGEHIYERIEIYKHDSWAATALYSGPGGQIVCKFNRIQPLLGLPLGWLGRRLAARERSALERLVDVPNVPDSLGDVWVDGKRLPNAVARRHIAGHPLGRREAVPQGFFETVENTLQLMHQRGIAYVDLHKRENIIVGDDGMPYMIDFQICMDVAHRRARGWPGIQWVFHLLCQADRYHLAKHRLHHETTDDGRVQAAMTVQRPWWISAHRKIAVPFRALRRRLLVLMGIRSGKGRAESEHFAEDAVRRDTEMHTQRLAA